MFARNSAALPSCVAEPREWGRLTGEAACPEQPRDMHGGEPAGGDLLGRVVDGGGLREMLGGTRRGGVAMRGDGDGVPPPLDPGGLGG